MKKNCLECGKELYVIESQLKRGRGKYCSRYCSKIGKRNPRWKADTYSNRICKYCNKEFLYRLSCRGKGETCSVLCRGKLQSLIRVGENNKNWKGGITDVVKKKRHLFRTLLREKIINRDKSTCRLCGEKNPFLHVDHIKSWKENIDLRFNEDNCRTLCAKCHYLVTYNRPMPKEVKAWGQSFSKGVCSV